MNENSVAVCFLILLFLLIVIFAGEPDLHDALIVYLTGAAT